MSISASEGKAHRERGEDDWCHASELWGSRPLIKDQSGCVYLLLVGLPTVSKSGGEGGLGLWSSFLMCGKTLPLSFEAAGMSASSMTSTISKSEGWISSHLFSISPFTWMQEKSQSRIILIHWTNLRIHEFDPNEQIFSFISGTKHVLMINWSLILWLLWSARETGLTRESKNGQVCRSAPAADFSSGGSCRRAATKSHVSHWSWRRAAWNGSWPAGKK